MKRLSGKVCMITDCANRVGSGVVRVLAEEGAKLILCCAPDAEVCADMLSSLDAMGTEYMVKKVALQNLEDREALAAEIKENPAFGCIDNLFLSEIPPIVKMSIEKMPREMWQGLVDNYVQKAFFVTKVFGDMMAESGKGNIVYLGSVNAEKPTGEYGLYSMYHGMLRNLNREAAIYYGRKGLKTASIEVGALGGEDEAFDTENSYFYQGYMYKIPSGYVGTPEDLGKLLVFLYSDENKYINGAEIRVDGGLLLEYMDMVANYTAYKRLEKEGEQ